MEAVHQILKSQFKTLYGYELETWQLKATEVYLYTNKDMVVKTPRGGRKSTWMDLMCAHTMLHKPNTFALIATVGVDLATEHIDRIRKFILSSPFASYITSPNNETEINLTNGSRVLAIPQSADTRVGYHPNVKFIDETSRIDPKFYYSTLLPMGRGLNPPSRNINVSTPNNVGGVNNVFNELWFKSGDEIFKLDVPIKDCYWITEEELEKERKLLPYLLFRQECLGEFVTNTGLPFADVDKVVIKEDVKIDYSHNFVFGIDLARKHDYTVVVVLDVDDGNKVVHLERNQAMWQTQVGVIKSLYDAFQPVNVVVDATGLGDVVEELLRDADISNITPFIFTNRTKSEIINKLILAVENNEIKIPEKFQQLIYELRWWEWDKKNLVDDCVMALAMAYWGANNNTGKITIMDAKLFESTFLY